MKKSIIVLSFATIVGLITFVLMRQERKLFLPADKNSERSKHPDRSLKNRLRLNQSKYVAPMKTKSLNTFPQECSSPLTDLSAMTAKEYQELITSRKSFVTFFREKCVEKMEANPTYKELMRFSNCKLSDEKEEVQGVCFTMLFMLKAHFIADHTSGKTPAEMTSQELAANFVKMFLDIDKLDKETFKENLKVVNALYEMHPDDPDVMEAYLGYMMIGKQVTNEDSVSSRIDELMHGTLGESFKVDRLHVMKDMLRNDLNSAKHNLDRLSNLYPKEPELAYYYAAYHWKQGNRTLATIYLDKAISLGANCSYCSPGLYGETKKRMAHAEVKDGKLFSLSFGLNFENL